MANSILNLIANPVTSDPVKSYNDAFQGARDNSLKNLALQTAMEDRNIALEDRSLKLKRQEEQDAAKQTMLSAVQSGDQKTIDAAHSAYAVQDPEAAKTITEVFQGMDTRDIQAVAFSVAGATFASDEQTQNDLLEYGLKVATPGSTASLTIKAIMDLPYGKERTVALTKSVGMLQQMGVLKPADKGPTPQKVDTGDGGWKYVTPTEGLTGRENPNKGKTEVNVNVGEKGLGKLAEEMAKSATTSLEAAKGARSGLENLYEVKPLLDSGIITGTGAEFLTGVGNALSSRLGFKAFDDPVANTQAYSAALGRQVGEVIKQFGSGTGISDADREYAEKIAGGKISMNEQALRRVMDINERAYKNAINSHNKMAKEIKSKDRDSSLLFDLEIALPDYKGTTPSTKPAAKKIKFVGFE